MKQLFVAILFIIALTKPCAAQDYKGAVGGRFGYGIGLTGIYMVDQRNGHGLEFLLRYGYHGLVLNRPGANIQVLYEKHWQFGRSGAWSGYVGGGPAIGFGKKTTLSKDIWFALGVSPIVGIDFTTQQLRIPIVLSLDYKPGFYADFPIGKQQVNKKVGSDLSFYEVAFSVRIGIQ